MLKVPSAISKVSTMADGGLRLQVDTQELTAPDKAELMGLHNQIGWFVFSPNSIQVEDIPTEAVETDQKTPSQRLRAVLFIYWKKQQENNGQRFTSDKDFDYYYSKTLEKLIEHYKQKIDELN